jgi:hypothetical protein
MKKSQKTRKNTKNLGKRRNPQKNICCQKTQKTAKKNTFFFRKQKTNYGKGRKPERYIKGI